MILKYTLDGTISCAYDIIEVIPLFVLQFSWACGECKVLVMDDFEPTEYLFQTHADKGNDRWEIYAWALREVMLKYGGLKPCDIPLRQKLIYEGYMQMNKKYPDPFAKPETRNPVLITEPEDQKIIDSEGDGQHSIIKSNRTSQEVLINM